MPNTHPSTSVPSTAAADRAAASTAASGSGASGASGAAHLAVSDVSKSYAERRVLSSVSFTARSGDRIGLIGENGTGKSTLLRILGGLEPADAGTVTHAGSVASLSQELPYPDETPLGRVLDDAQREALAARDAIEAAGAAFAQRPDDAALGDAYTAALERAERCDAWQSEARRGEVLTGLGLGGIRESTAVGELSGGQRLRLALAALLLEAPHTMLLDEPSNHLDDASAAYLERVLVGWPGIVIVASHDRALLDAVATRILDLDPAPVPAELLPDAAPATGEDPDPAARELNADASASVGTGVGTDVDDSTDDTGSGFGVRVWGMGYSAAREAQRAELRRWRERYDAELAERAALVHEIEIGSREVNRKHESKSESRITKKFYADKDARVTARRARNARVRLEELQRARVRRPPEPLRFAGLGDPGRLGRGDAPLLEAERVALAGRLAPVSFSVPRGGRLLLEGPNGAGKSTLLAILAGELSADAGSLRRAQGQRIGYLPQEVSFDRPRERVLECYRRAVGAERAERHPLARTGLLAARDLDRPVGALSVGQRRRLALAVLAAAPPQLLLLDEPSNHLSLTLVEELEAALNGFRGALVIATHDRWLRSRWQGDVLTLTPAARDERGAEFAAT